jgi:hypothetical protein
MASTINTTVQSDSASGGGSSGGTTLHGRIEAIGIHDLLRVSAVKHSTGRLLVFNDLEDAELYYEQGRLVAAISAINEGNDCLRQVLSMHEGEFEFASGMTAPADRKCMNLHEVMLTAVKQYYEDRVGARSQISTNNRVFPTSDTAAITSLLGQAAVDVTGHILRKTGDFSTQDAALVSLVHKLADNIGTLLGQSHLKCLELLVPRDKSLVCARVDNTWHVVKVGPDYDLDLLWEFLKL